MRGDRPQGYNSGQPDRGFGYCDSTSMYDSMNACAKVDHYRDTKVIRGQLKDKMMFGQLLDGHRGVQSPPLSRLHACAGITTASRFGCSALSSDLEILYELTKIHCLCKFVFGFGPKNWRQNTFLVLLVQNLHVTNPQCHIQPPVLHQLRQKCKKQ